MYFFSFVIIFFYKHQTEVQTQKRLQLSSQIYYKTVCLLLHLRSGRVFLHRCILFSVLFLCRTFPTPQNLHQPPICRIQKKYLIWDRKRRRYNLNKSEKAPNAQKMPRQASFLQNRVSLDSTTA